MRAVQTTRSAAPLLLRSACLLSAVAQRRSALRSDGSVRTAIRSRRYQNAGHRKQSHRQVRGIASGTNEEWPH